MAKVTTQISSVLKWLLKSHHGYIVKWPLKSYQFCRKLKQLKCYNVYYNIISVESVDEYQTYIIAYKSVDIQFKCTRYASEITFIGCTNSQKIGKPNNVKVLVGASIILYRNLSWLGSSIYSESHLTLGIILLFRVRLKHVCY